MRVGTLGRSQSAPALIKTPAAAQVNPDRAQQWATVAREQAHAQQPLRRQALQTAQALAVEAMRNEGATASLQAELAGLELPDPDLPPDEFKQAELDFAKKLGATLSALARSKAKDLVNFEPPKYGGDIGNRIFESFIGTVTVPATKHFIDALAQATEAYPVGEAREQVNTALTQLIDIGTRDRGLIAHMTGTKNAHQFGERIPAKGHLRDPVSERPTWKNWSAAMVKTINAHFAGGTFSQARPSDLWPEGTITWIEDKSLHVITAKDGRTRLVLDSTASQGVFESCSGTGVRYTFDQYKSSIINIDCHHVPTPAQEPTESTFQNEVFELIRMRAPAPAELQQGLARLLHRISTSSLLFRGGAAFTEQLLQAFAQHHGYRLTFSPAWTPPNGIPPDQQALSLFDIDDFVRSGAANLLLTPDTPG